MKIEKSTIAIMIIFVAAASFIIYNKLEKAKMVDSTESEEMILIDGVMMPASHAETMSAEEHMQMIEDENIDMGTTNSESMNMQIEAESVDPDVDADMEASGDMMMDMETGAEEEMIQI